jgi:2-phosphoglycerate kinase
MNPGFKVLLVGGSSASGKSTLARSLAKHYKFTLTEVDDIRITLQSVVDKEKHPDLFFFSSNPARIQEGATPLLVSKLADVAREIWPALNTLIDKHLWCNEPIVFEGDGILPELLAKRDQTDVRAIFLYDDRKALKERDIQRNRGGHDGKGAEKQSDFSYQYNLELARQAEKAGYAVIKASPIDTLLSRTLAVLEG